MRWLHLEGADRLNILRLGVKYSVHPLAVEDSLKLEEQQPKVRPHFPRPACLLVTLLC